MERKMIITIDGPAGSGKSTVSKVLARKLDYVYLDSGALYRALAYKALKLGIALDDAAGLQSLCSGTKVVLKNVDGQVKVYVDGEDVGDKIRKEEVGLAASKISTFPIVRQSLLHLQREAGAQGGIVAEGRDMASVVFPQANHKFYLDAAVKERIKRRHNELLGKGKPAEYRTIEQDMLLRDKQDTQREIAPLKPTADAFVIDSTDLSVTEVVEKIIRQILNK
jgi:cytidylate kinase